MWSGGELCGVVGNCVEWWGNVWSGGEVCGVVQNCVEC